MVSVWYLVVTGAVAVDRLAEMAYSRRNQKKLGERGARRVHDPVFGGMVALHVGYLCASPLEVTLFHRPFLPWLGWPALVVLAAANALRVWAIRSLSIHWNMQIVASQSLGAVSSGPYRWIRQSQLCGGIPRGLGAPSRPYGLGDGPHCQRGPCRAARPAHFRRGKSLDERTSL
jgi:methyltransferase